MRLVRTQFVAPLALLAVLALTLVLASPAQAIAVISYADQRPTYTGWATVGTDPCVPVVAPTITRPPRTDPYCSVRFVQPQCFTAPCPPMSEVRGVWAYSFDIRRWHLLAPDSRIHVYASPRSSEFAWVWTARTGFLVMPKRLILLPMASSCAGPVCPA